AAVPNAATFPSYQLAIPNPPSITLGSGRTVRCHDRVIPAPFAPYAGRRQQEYGSLQFSDPTRGNTCSGRLLAMAIAQPERGGLLPGRTAPSRGSLATTARMETLQVAYPLAAAAAAGRSLSQPSPDTGIAWHVRHTAPGHTVDDEVTIKVQLKATYQVPPRPPGRSFAFTLDNAHLAKLARTPVTVHKILVVMLVPRSPDDWLRAG